MHLKVDSEGSVRKQMKAEDDLYRKKVLVIDDNETAGEIFQSYLENIGFRVETAASGLSALDRLEAAAKDPVDIVLIDWKMPEMDGMETCKRIYAMKRLTPMPKIIMATAYGREEVQEAALEIGFDGFVTKPVTQSTLYDAIMTAYGREGVGKRGKRVEYLVKTKDIQGAHILLAEDNEINQQIAVEILESAGLLVDVASNGREAVDAVKIKAYDLVLMDIQMPKMDGMEAANLIRKFRTAKDLPIIAMTAHAMVGDREKSIAAGMQDHVTKPIDPERVFSALIQWIPPGNRKLPEEFTLQQNANISKNKSEVDLPADLPGIDVEAGLKVTQNNVKLYRKLLLKFLAKQANFADTFNNARKSNDSHDAAIIAHSLKGVAGNLGMKEVHHAAFALESAVNENSDHIDDPLQDVVVALEPVLSGLKKMQKNLVVENSDGDETIDLSRIAPLLTELGDCLSEDDIQSIDVAEKLKPFLVNTPHVSLFDHIRQAIDNYDFEQAENDFRELMSQLGVSIQK